MAEHSNDKNDSFTKNKKPKSKTKYVFSSDRKSDCSKFNSQQNFIPSRPLLPNIKHDERLTCFRECSKTNPEKSTKTTVRNNFLPNLITKGRSDQRTSKDNHLNAMVCPDMSCKKSQNYIFDNRRKPRNKTNNKVAECYQSSTHLLPQNEPTSTKKSRQVRTSNSDLSKNEQKQRQPFISNVNVSNTTSMTKDKLNENDNKSETDSDWRKVKESSMALGMVPAPGQSNVSNKAPSVVVNLSLWTKLKHVIMITSYMRKKATRSEDGKTLINFVPENLLVEQIKSRASHCTCEECEQLRTDLWDLRPKTKFEYPAHLGKLRRDYKFLKPKISTPEADQKDDESHKKHKNFEFGSERSSKWSSAMSKINTINRFSRLLKNL